MHIHVCFCNIPVEFHIMLTKVFRHSSITSDQSKTLEQLQRRACRIILGQRFTSYKEAVEVCGLEFLKDRRESHCRRFAEGLAKSDRKKDLISPYRLGAHGRNLRNTHNISQLRARTSRFQNSHVPYYINLIKGARSDCFRFFFQTFGDFGIRRKLLFFSLLLVNFRAEKCTVWKILN